MKLLASPSAELDLRNFKYWSSRKKKGMTQLQTDKNRTEMTVRQNVDRNLGHVIQETAVRGCRVVPEGTRKDQRCLEEKRIYETNPDDTEYRRLYHGHVREETAPFLL